MIKFKIGDEVLVVSTKDSTREDMVGHKGTVVRVHPHFINEEYGCPSCESMKRKCANGGVDYGLTFNDDPHEGWEGEKDAVWATCGCKLELANKQLSLFDMEKSHE